MSTRNPNAVRAEAAGLTKCYFSNGTEFMMFEEKCERCRHFIDDLFNPKPGRLEPPFNTCAWGVLDRIYEAMASDRYGYGASYHPPEDMEMKDGLWPHCKRWTNKNDDDPSRQPPRRDVPGQMMLGEDLAPVERVPLPQLVSNDR